MKPSTLVQMERPDARYIITGCHDGTFPHVHMIYRTKLEAEAEMRRLASIFENDVDAEVHWTGGNLEIKHSDGMETMFALSWVSSDAF